jgi:CBS domain-containing protein
MQVKDVMTADPTCCTVDTSLEEVAQMMVECDCGCIPIIDNEDSMRPIGTVTDRDITIRAVAEGMNPLEMTAGDIMSSPVVTVTPETSIEECSRLMGENQVRRVVVVDNRGACCGMVAQADLALDASSRVTAEVVEKVSQPAGAALLR